MKDKRVVFMGTPEFAVPVLKKLIENTNVVLVVTQPDKQSGRHLIQSYDANIADEKKIGNTCVGLTMYEAKLCIKKMNRMGWKVKDGIRR